MSADSMSERVIRLEEKFHGHNTWYNRIETDVAILKDEVVKIKLQIAKWSGAAIVIGVLLGKLIDHIWR